MNSTLFLNKSIPTTIESWFIPLDIITLICPVIVIILAIFFLLIIILDKKCHTVPMMLIINTCLAELLLASILVWMIVFELRNDLTSIQYEDALCNFRGYFGYSACALQNYSFLLQSIYRYITVVYPKRLFWQSLKIQILLISSTWIFAFLFPLPFLFTGDIIYNVDSQVCQIPLRLSFALLFILSCVYIIPVVIIMFIYFKLVAYVREMHKRVTSLNILLRAQRDLKMVRRIVLIVSILLTIGLPYTIFALMSFFTTPPKYHYRIAVIFIDISITFIMIVILRITEPLKEFVKKIICGRSNMILPTVT